MKKCPDCNKSYQQRKSKTPDGVPYQYSVCPSCGDEILNMNDFQELAEKYRSLKKHRVKLNKWGPSLGLRLPKELATEYHLDEKTTVNIIPQKKGWLVIPE